MNDRAGHDRRELHGAIVSDWGAKRQGGGRVGVGYPVVVDGADESPFPSFLRRSAILACGFACVFAAVARVVTPTTGPAAASAVAGATLGLGLGAFSLIEAWVAGKDILDREKFAGAAGFVLAAVTILVGELQAIYVVRLLEMGGNVPRALDAAASTINPWAYPVHLASAAAPSAVIAMAFARGLSRTKRLVVAAMSSALIPCTPIGVWSGLVFGGPDMIPSHFWHDPASPGLLAIFVLVPWPALVLAYDGAGAAERRLVAWWSARTAS